MQKKHSPNMTEPETKNDKSNMFNVSVMTSNLFLISIML